MIFNFIEGERRFDICNDYGGVRLKWKLNVMGKGMIIFIKINLRLYFIFVVCYINDDSNLDFFINVDNCDYVLVEGY